MSLAAAVRSEPTARLLADGHVEFAHTCLDGERVAGLLPSPPWRVTQTAPYLAVEPSIGCARCDLHTWVGHPLVKELPA
jgi:hypothetical protein